MVDQEIIIEEEILMDNIEEEFEVIQSRFDKLRNSIFYQMGVYLFGAAGALLASFVLTTDALANRYFSLSDTEKFVPPCDVNEILSCSTVAESWQATLIHIGDFLLPNSMLGMVAETVFVSIAVVLISKGNIAKWIHYGLFYGTLGSTIFAYWLFSQELYVINALCPWCLLLLGTQTIMMVSLWRYQSLNELLPFPFHKLRGKIKNFTETNWGFYIFFLWVIIVITWTVLHYTTHII